MIHSFRQSALSQFLVLLGFVLLFAAGARAIETNFGDILIHDIDVESYEGFLYHARLYRPVQAQSLNRRPGILLIGGFDEDRQSLSSCALELARRGFVALTIDDFGQGTTPAQAEEYTENAVDAGFTFLQTRTFVEDTHLGLLAHSFGVCTALESFHLPEFQSVIFSAFSESSVDSWLKTLPQNAALSADHVLMLQPKIEPFAAFRDSSHSSQDSPSAGGTRRKVYLSSHMTILAHPPVISDMLEWFHETLAIPNDTPFWFSSSRLLAPLRQACLFFSFCALLFSLTRLGKILQKIPAMDFDPFDSGSLPSIPRKYRWVNGILMMYLFLQAFLSCFSETIHPENSSLFSVLEPLSTFLRWGAVISVLLFFVSAFQSWSFHLDWLPRMITHVLRSLLISGALFLFLYGGIDLLQSELVQIRPGFLSIYLKPLDLGKNQLFLSCLLPAIALFWAQGRLFLSEPSDRKNFCRIFLNSIGAILVLVLILYLPLFFSRQNGLEWLIGRFFSTDSAVLAAYTHFLSAYGCGMLAIISVFWVAAFMLFSLLQVCFFRCFQSRFPGALLNGAILAWMIASANTSIII